MIITEKTKEILKNFANINSSFLIRKGNKQFTISPDDTVYAEATLADDFTFEMAIYDLPQFLANLSLLTSPKLEFSDNKVNITDKDSFDISFRGCDKTIIHIPDDDMGSKISIDNPDIHFNLTINDLQKLLRVASTNAFNNLTVFSKGGKMGIRVADSTDTSNSGVMYLESLNKMANDFECIFKVENFKMLPLNYDVKIKRDAFAIFENTDGTLRYIVSLEAKKKGK